jgi:ligand-binding SRPBCC domain-containing protein
MPLIKLTTFVKAPLERVFDLSRSIDLHKKSMIPYGEKPVAGRISGLVEQGDSVTWQAKHLLKERTLSVKITAMQEPHSFVDELVKGDFTAMKHEHYFKVCDNGTFIIDHFYFESPYGVLGTWLNRLYLTRYMRRLLETRNAVIKEVAESNQWKHYLIKEGLGSRD